MGIKLKEIENDPGTYMFWCPGCSSYHQVWTKGSGRPNWGFNGSLEKPTFTPSLNVTWPWGNPPVENRCHSFIRDGFIQYLGDCTHELAGKTVEIPDYAEVEK